jgi:KipI family sensor histidine kinase inhibitor
VSAVRPFGDRGVLVEVADNDAVHRVAAAARAAHGDALSDVVAGHRTVLLAFHRPPVDRRVVDAVLATASDGTAGDVAGEQGDPVVIPVAYDGPDLQAVAEHAGFSPEEVARRHVAAAYRVAFVGFAPGFAYLLGGDPALQVPRREDPRERVPMGSVAIAGEYTAVYPTASPGGWQLIGSTDRRLFDPDRDPPALLQAGMAVRFA